MSSCASMFHKLPAARPNASRPRLAWRRRAWEIGGLILEIGRLNHDTGDTKKAGQVRRTVSEKFRRFESELSQPSWLLPLRKAGMARFAGLGFPTLHDEDWRFTNVAPIARLPFKPVFAPVRRDITFDDLHRFAFSQIKCRRLVFVDGHYCRGFTPDRPEDENHELHIGSLRHALSEGKAREIPGAVRDW